jgi:iron-sulfur cluster repair protein YtfE (RIC family)
MLRDKNLVPLSHQHQHALALCVRIERASPIRDVDLGAWLAEVTQHFRSEIQIHFTAEEQVLFPAARKFEELTALVVALLKEHRLLREGFAAASAGNMSAKELGIFAQRLSTHIRKEERLLFERMQELMNKEELTALGSRLGGALKDADQACVLPAATRLRPSK